jgi:hypothetical protein
MSFLAVPFLFLHSRGDFPPALLKLSQNPGWSPRIPFLAQIAENLALHPAQPVFALPSFLPSTRTPVPKDTRFDGG